MYIIQNCNNQARHSQYNHEFLISRHKHLPFPQDSERVAAALPAALVSILYCQGDPPRGPDPERNSVKNQKPGFLQGIETMIR